MLSQKMKGMVLKVCTHEPGQPEEEEGGKKVKKMRKEWKEGGGWEIKMEKGKFG